MKSFTVHRGRVATMNRSNVDTDQIIPKQFLKRIERTGFGKYLFFDWRFNPDGTENPSFELNRPSVRGASILVGRQNFGNGSSREHAVWALEDFGFRAVIASSFADIFFNNCFKNGVLPITLTASEVEHLHQQAQLHTDYELTIDLERQVIQDSYGWRATFSIDEFRRKCLLEGLDDIGLTLQFQDKITEYEAQRGMTPIR